jgi:hypothetical protein
VVKVRFAKGSFVGIVVAILVMATAGPALAKEVHIFTGAFGAGELSLTEQSGVAINQETGDVYVGDTGDNRILHYGPSGTPEGSLATATEPTFLALDNSPGGSADLYVVERGRTVITKMDPSGTPITAWGTAGHMEGFGEITGIAVDPSGNLFVMNAQAALYELGQGGNQTGQCTAPNVFGKTNPDGIAVDADHDIYLNFENANHQVNKITAPPTCESLGEGDGHNRFPESIESETYGVAVDEADNSTFRSMGVYLYHLSAQGSVLEVFGKNEGLDEGRQLAVRSASATVYLADAGKQEIDIFSVVNVEPPQVTIEPPTAVTGTTAHFHAEINPEAPVNDPPPWNVKYSFQCVPGCTGSDLSGTVGAGSIVVPREGTAEHLLPGTEYNVYITAENVGGVARSPEAPQEGLPFITGFIPPSISEETISEASTDSVRINALVNPGGTEADYAVQYVTMAQFEASGFTGASETPQESLAPSGEGVAVSVPLAGLAPSSTYVARFVATNTVEGSLETAYGEPLPFATRMPSLPFGGCPNEAFRTEASALLPDCRAYELASPANKGGGSVEAVPGSLQAPGKAGDAITFFSQAGIPGGVGAQDYPTFLASRGGGSWATTGLLPPQEFGEIGAYLGLTPDGRYSVTEADHGGQDAGVFLRNLETGAITTVVPYNTGCSHFCFSLAGASEDGSRIFLETELELDKEPPTTTGPRNLYMWDRGTGRISLVSVDQNGEPLPEGAFAGPYDWPDLNLAVGGSANHMYVPALNAIAPDGEQAVFTERGEREGHGQLYVRLGLGGPAPKTVKVSSYAAGQGGPEEPAAFLEATPNGRYVFFKSKAQLTKDSYAGDGEGTESLYRYETPTSETSTGKLVDVTTEAKTLFEKGPGVIGMLGTSESGQVAYFVSTTKLTSVPGPDGNVAEEGQANVYRWQEGAKPAITFVAALKDGPLYGGTVEGLESDSRDWSPSIVDPRQEGNYTAKTARVSADGSSVVFSSRRPLTELPSRATACSYSSKLVQCPEFFRYSAATATLDCISCNPTGERPLNGASIGTGLIDAGDLPEVLAEPTLSRNLSADGDRFFFQTPDSLVPGDRNGGSTCTATPNEKESCLDVYEWEAPGTPGGTCQVAEVDGGCVYLISSGEGDQPSYFGDADPEGRNVFILTASRLVPLDRDELYDVYDASVEGGLASQHETPASPCDSRTSCQGPAAGAQEGSTPGSSTLVGPGNATRLKACKKGFVRKHGKCVKKHKSQKKKHNTSKKKHRSSKKKKKKRAGGGRGGRK